MSLREHIRLHQFHSDEYFAKEMEQLLVVLLCAAVESSENAEFISAIQRLEGPAQICLMTAIEEGKALFFVHHQPTTQAPSPVAPGTPVHDVLANYLNSPAPTPRLYTGHSQCSTPLANGIRTPDPKRALIFGLRRDLKEARTVS